MLRKTIKLLALLVVFCTLFSITASAEMPESKSSKYIFSYDGGCSWNGSSTVKVRFDITAKRYVDQLGASQILLYESTDLSTWTLVKTFTYSSYSNMMAYNTIAMGSNVSYSNAVSGRHYKATITFIVIEGSDSETRTFYTPYI